jgi:hypothetical protein
MRHLPSPLFVGQPLALNDPDRFTDSDLEAKLYKNAGTKVSGVFRPRL